MDTQAPMQGTWRLVAPDGKQWEGQTPLQAYRAEQATRVSADEIYRRNATAKLRDLARELECYCEDDLRTLTGWTEETTRARRKRGNGPPYILIGKNYFYPRAALLKHFKAMTAGRRAVPQEDLL